MNIKTLKDIMKQVNEPNEFVMVPHDLVHPLYWIWKVENCRLKILDSRLSTKRKEKNRFDSLLFAILPNYFFLFMPFNFNHF